ncbi:hypothetical protein F4776DRAFT_521366 [Hypoxylon sp. NC0597]|nr:hypothetical protein F4776DRAFT_521366 [Hypoxylon sp. NC0597]
MKYAVAAAALAAISSAQSLSDIPQCAIPCINDARTSSTNCAADDYACICRNKDALTAAATSCVLTSCGAEVATGQVLPAVNAFCDAVESGSGGSSASSSTIASVTSTVTSTDASSTRTSAADTPTSSIESVSTVSVSSATPGSVIASNSTTSSTLRASPTNSNPTTVPTAGAASLVGSVAMLAVGFVAAL